MIDFNDFSSSEDTIHFINMQKLYTLREVVWRFFERFLEKFIVFVYLSTTDHRNAGERF